MCDAVKQLLEGVKASFGNYALILQKSARAIEQIPLPYGIERIEKRIVWNRARLFPRSVNFVVGIVEHFYGVTVEHP